MCTTVRRQLAILNANLLSLTILNNLQPVNTNNETSITHNALFFQVSYIIYVTPDKNH